MDRSVKELAEMLNCSERGIRKALPEVDRAKEQSSLHAEQSSLKREQSSVILQESSKETINNNSNNNLTTLSIYEQALNWLTENEEWLRKLCERNNLPTDEPVRTLQPHIDNFIDWLQTIGVDLEKKGQTDTRRHFASWLPKHLRNNVINNKNFINHERVFKTTPVDYRRQREQQRLNEIARACEAGLSAAKQRRGLL